MSVKSKRSCWHCGGKLLMDTKTKVIMHAVAQTPDGKDVWVHVACKDKTEAERLRVTAQPSYFPDKPEAE